MNVMTQRLSMWAVVVTAILLIPLLARAPWTMFDFVFAGGVLFGAATIYEVATKNRSEKTYRMTVAAVVLIGVLAIWAWAVAGP